MKVQVSPNQQRVRNPAADSYGQDLMAMLAPQARDAPAQRLFGLFINHPELGFDFLHPKSYHGRA